MAQCIADKLYKIARGKGKEKQIEFDYFEYTARENDPKSTYNLRKRYGHRIDKPKKQPLYSHLIDAQLAFLIASEDHKNDGSMGIKFEENQTVWEPTVDTETGEVLPSKSFSDSEVGDKKCVVVNLNRKKSNTGVRLHRSFHRSNFYAENYVPLFIGKKGKDIEVKAGFSWGNSVKINITKKIESKIESNIFNLLKFAKNESISKWDGTNKTLEDLSDWFSKKIVCSGFEIFYIDWDKTKIQKHLVDEFSNEHISGGTTWSEEIIFLRKLSYRTKKQEIKKAQDVGKTETKKYFDIRLFKGTVELPAKTEWQRLSKEWREFDSDDFFEFLNKHFKQKKNNQHRKVRKVFSLPVVDTGGHFIQKRKSWNEKNIYQIVADSESRKDGNKFSRLVMMPDGELKEVINKPFISKNIFKLKRETLEINENYCNINPYKWYEISQEDNVFPSGVNKIEYCIDNTTRPQIRIYLAENFTKCSIDDILQNSLTKPRENKELKEKLNSDDAPLFLEYKASGFNQKIKAALLAAMTG